MKVYDAVANAFIKEGGTTVFGLLGDGQLRWWSSMVKHKGAKLIDVREEGQALAMADGWARASGKVGVCSVTHGPGLARLSLSLISAARARTPIVVHTATTTFNDERETQYLNQDRFVSASECGYIEVMKPDYAEEAVRQAFYRARREARPIVLSIPVDVDGKECESESRARPGPCVTLHTPTLPDARAHPSAIASACPSSRTSMSLTPLCFAMDGHHLNWPSPRSPKTVVPPSLTNALATASYTFMTFPFSNR